MEYKINEEKLKEVIKPLNLTFLDNVILEKNSGDIRKFELSQIWLEKINQLFPLIHEHFDEIFEKHEYSYKKCKFYLQSKGFKVDEQGKIGIKIYGSNEIFYTSDTLYDVVNALNENRTQRFTHFPTDSIYTFLKGNEDLMEE